MFEPMNFIYYLKYMGVGILGVFIIIGIIMAATYAMGTIKTNQTDKDDGEQ